MGNKASNATSDSPGKKEKKGVFNQQWLNDAQFKLFLREYKPDRMKAHCIVCNEQFSIHHGGKNDVDRHMKLKFCEIHAHHL
ncbi:unnamed protein product [Adineta ricciae]|uniref:Uncharacterized protein n=1 Tax=Adineta ricciae TaxID=249248 RepID=A0A815J3A1_ADIRI|nr:unnamed protein product [Adineta ricciae]CAF1428603.1 unnamed protein product [Adineta ricciae]